MTTILFQLPTDPPLTGRYMFHCHTLEHEDHDMRRPFDVVPRAVRVTPATIPLWRQAAERAPVDRAAHTRYHTAMHTSHLGCQW